VGQPEGFVLSPESSLRVRVFERELAFANGIPLLSRDMQTPVQVTPKLTNSSSTVPEEVTVTTLDPSKIVLSSDGGLTSRDSLVVPMRVPMVLQAGPGATPGDRVRIRLASPGYATTEAEVRIAPAELQRYSDSVLELQPENDFNRLDLVYGPVDSPLATAVSQSFSGAMKPGIDVFLTVTSSDPSVVEVAQPQVRLDRSMQVRLRALRPGSAELRVEAPAGIDNKIAPIPVTVLPFRFQLTRSESPAAFLVSRLTIRNPRKQAVPITFSAPASSVLFGTAASGSAAPSLSILTVTVGPSEERSIFLQATSPQQSSANIRVSAPDFVTLDEYLSIQKPVIRFNQSGPVVAALGNGSMTVSLVTGVNLSELPLGNSLGGPLRIQLQSSNPQVVRVPATPVEIQPGESRKSAVLQLTGRGEAVVSFITASGFDAGTNQTISVTVR
ncbi:MAG TPA: hypothetical protein VER03_07725, partial [Bryobacteraceae bacterium]|nr:hypothetical protein [Bryobacteraceae bacterium]